LKAKVEVYYFGFCPWSYFFSYGGDFLDEAWTRTGGDFKADLERLGVEVVEFNMLENKEMVEKHAKSIDPYNPFSSHTRFIIDDKEVSKGEFFRAVRGLSEKVSGENSD
jgi:hypothetical protein